jgi:hypothetical protein
MKIYLFTLIFIITTGIAKADDFDKYNEFSKHLSEELAKEYKLFKPECDLCACYLGIDPSYNSSQIGIRYSSFQYFTPGQTETNPNLDHEEHSTEDSYENYDNFELTGRYYFSPQVRILLNAPYSMNDINGKRIRDFGDVSIIGQYQVFNTDIDADTELRHRIFVGGGIKLPTGAYNKSIVFGEVDPHFQPGTGSYDFILSGTYLARYKGKFGLSTDAIYTLNTTNSNDYRFSNKLNITSTLFYMFEAGKKTRMGGQEWTFLPHAGAYLEYAGKDTQNGVDVDGSGGTVLFLTGGLDVYYNQFTVNFTYQYPASENLNGDQPENQRRIFIGAGYSF